MACCPWPGALTDADEKLLCEEVLNDVIQLCHPTRDTDDVDRRCGKLCVYLRTLGPKGPGDAITGHALFTLAFCGLRLCSTTVLKDSCIGVRVVVNTCLALLRRAPEVHQSTASLAAVPADVGAFGTIVQEVRGRVEDLGVAAIHSVLAPETRSKPLAFMACSVLAVDVMPNAAVADAACQRLWDLLHASAADNSPITTGCAIVAWKECARRSPAAPLEALISVGRLVSLSPEVGAASLLTSCLSMVEEAFRAGVPDAPRAAQDGKYLAACLRLFSSAAHAWQWDAVVHHATSVLTWVASTAVRPPDQHDWEAFVRRTAAMLEREPHTTWNFLGTVMRCGGPGWLVALVHSCAGVLVTPSRLLRLAFDHLKRAGNDMPDASPGLQACLHVIGRRHLDGTLAYPSALNRVFRKHPTLARLVHGLGTHPAACGKGAPAETSPEGASQDVRMIAARLWRDVFGAECADTIFDSEDRPLADLDAS